MRILIDIDGIVTETLTPWLHAIEAEQGGSVPRWTITQWDMFECDSMRGVDVKAALSILQRPGFTRHLQFIEGAYAGVRELSEMHEVYLVTSRSGVNHVKETVEWFKESFPFLKDSQLVFCADKEIIDADVLIDDRAETLLKYKDWHPGAHVIALAYAYNLSYVASEIKFCPKWDTILKVIRGLE